MPHIQAYKGDVRSTATQTLLFLARKQKNRNSVKKWGNVYINKAAARRRIHFKALTTSLFKNQPAGHIRRAGSQNNVINIL